MTTEIEPVATPIQMLSPREKQVICGAANGGSYQTIGSRLKLSRHTIKNYLQGAYRKLDALNMTEAVMSALKLGFIEPVIPTIAAEDWKIITMRVGNYEPEEIAATIGQSPEEVISRISILHQEIKETNLEIFKVSDTSSSDAPDPETNEQTPERKITPREMDVIRELVKGNTNDAIANILNVSFNTAKNYVGNILKKFALPNRAALVNYALENNLVDVSDEPVLIKALSIREEEVSILVAKGLTNKQIADLLGISPHTAKTHVYNVLEKTGARNRTHLVAMNLGKNENVSLENGIIPS